MIRFLRTAAAAVALATAMPVLVPPPVAAQLSVIDSSNLTQNVLQAARALEQINNQIQSLQNQAVMLQNMAHNLSTLNFSQLGEVTNDLRQISTLMSQAQGITFDVQSVQAAFRQAYPQQYSASTDLSQILGDAQTRWQNARNAFQQSMSVQSQIAQTVQSDSAKLVALVGASQGASGNLEVSQATNQLLALSIKQQLQIQTLLAAQGRAEALSGANDIEAKEEGRAAFQTFLGSNTAYTPR